MFILALAGFFSIVFQILGTKGRANKIHTLLGVIGTTFIAIFSNNFCAVLRSILTNLHTKISRNGNLNISALLSQYPDSVNFMSVMGGWYTTFCYWLRL